MTGWITARRWLLLMYAAIGTIWWALVVLYTSSTTGPLDGVERVFVWTMVLALVTVWLGALVGRRSWPTQTLALHAIILGEIVRYAVIVLAQRSGWWDVDVALWTDFLRASIWTGGVILIGESAAHRWGRRRPRSGWAASPGPSVTLAALSQAMPMMFVDELGVIKNATASTEKLTGYPLDDLLGRPLTDLIPTRFHAAHLAGFARYLKMGSGEIIGRDTAIDIYMTRKDGTEIAAALVVTTIVEDGRRWFIGGFMRRVDTASVNEERTISANERMAEATERMADQVDAALANGTTDVAEQVETGRAAGHSAGRAAERVGVAEEIQAGHDAGLAEGRAEERE